MPFIQFTRELSLDVSVICRIAILFAVIFLSSVVHANDYKDIGVPVARVFDSEAHRGGTQLWSIAQASNGLIYSGGNSGVVEWDGERWRQYHTPSNTRVRSMSVGNDGRLYAGTTNDIGYFASNDIGILAYHSLVDDWSFEKRQFGEIWATATNDLGTVYASDHAIYFWDGAHVQTVLEDKEKRLGINTIFATKDGFIYKRRNDPNVYKVQLDPSKTGFTPTVVVLPLKLPANTTLRKIIVSQNNTLIAFTSWHGIFEEIDGQFVNRFGPEGFGDGSYLRDGMQSKDGYYYVITSKHGVFIFDKHFVLQKHYTEEHNLETESLYAITEDNQSNIWLSGRVNIIKFVPPHLYSTYTSETNSTGTENIGLLRGNPTIAGYGLLTLGHADDPYAPATFKNIKSNSEFNFHFIEYQGYLIYSERPGIHAIKLAQTTESQPIKMGDVETIGEPFKIVDELEAKMFAIDPVSNALFVSTFAPGLIRINLNEGEWNYTVIPDTNDYLDRIEIDEQGVIWVGTPTQELYRIENAQFDEKPTKVEKFSSLPPNNVFPFKLGKGIVFGTDNGWMEFNAASEAKFDSAAGLPEKFSQLESPLYRLFEDDQQRIWYQVGNSKGFLQQQIDGRWNTHETMFKPFPEISTSGFARTGEDIVWYALNTGPVFRIDFKRMQQPAVGSLNIRYIVDLNTSEEVYGGQGTYSLGDRDQRTNSMRIFYALTDNSIDNKTVYRHRLLGSSNERWSQWSREDQKDFTELRGADYQFELEARDGWGRVLSQSLSFRVLPPWYLSKTAWAVYVLIALVMLFLSGWLTQRWRTQKLQQQNIALENTVDERTREVRAKVDELKEQQELKDRFFSNVSHEFRTPLTLTIGPLETVLSEHGTAIDKQVSSLTQTALSNANKMLALVGQVLDLNRLEAGKLPLRISEYDIAELLRILQQRFEPWARQEGQTIVCSHCEEPLLLYFDQDQIDKCVANLLSNAIKYSGKNTQITVNIVDHVDTVTVQIIDNGQGISEKAQEKVFERFYQEKSSEQHTTPGTGIGLSLVKELIELHHGSVSLSTELGQGCCFSLELKKGKQHFSKAQLVEPLQLTNTHLLPGNALPSENDAQQQQDQTTLLVVDDNVELRNFISLRLSANYRIIQAQDGEEGFAVARTSLPDLIISDVMMPKMTGYEFATKLKQTSATRSIPIILLTAKASKREIVEGFASGADDYLSKPFDTSELVMRVNALINMRKTIRETVQFEQSLVVVDNANKSDFVEKINGHVLSHLSRPEFSVEQLAELMFMSRATLSRKSKEELGMSPRILIIQTRIQHACHLLQKSNLSISEVAYAVGFESLAYFSTSFKKHTGKTPSEYR